MNEPALTEITLEDIESLAVGAWILGTGGGGSPYLGLLNLRRLYAEGYRVQLMSPLDLDDDDRVAVVSNMGAPRRWSAKSASPTAATSPARWRCSRNSAASNSAP